MMSRLMRRAEAVASAAQRRRLDELAAGFRAQGTSTEITAGAIVCRGKRLVQRWLTDPALRFLGKVGS